MKHKILALTFLLLFCAPPAIAQPNSQSVEPGLLTTPISPMSVSNASSRVALPSSPTTFRTLTIYNKGTVDVYVVCGGSTVTATTASTYIGAGSHIAMALQNSCTYLAAITAGSTSSLALYQSTGSIEIGRVGGPPSGPAGGDLSGTYPNPTVANLSNVTNGSLANNGLAHSSLTVAGHSIALGATQTLACADLSDSAAGCSAAAANPSATIGASAVNGSASSFMRSDAAPALPATLPALSGVNLTALNATNLTSGTVAATRQTKGLAWSFYCKNADVHTATGDICTLAIPANITEWQVVGVSVTHCTAASPVFTIQPFTAAGGTGSSVTNSNAISGGHGQIFGFTGSQTTTNFVSNSVFFRVTVADSNPDICDFVLSLRDFS